MPQKKQGKKWQSKQSENSEHRKIDLVGEVIKEGEGLQRRSYERKIEVSMEQRM